MSDAWYAQPIETDPIQNMVDEIERLRDALEEIARKRKLDATAAASMRAIARSALSPSHRGTEA